MAFWSCRETAMSTPHVHDFDEYMVVVEGCYTLIIGDAKIPVRAGEEYLIPRGVLHKRSTEDSVTFMLISNPAPAKA